MLREQIQSKRLRWIVRFSCAVVKLSIYGICSDHNNHADCEPSKSFLIEGYQAGILGGVQDTKPFLSAIGVCSCLPIRVQRSNKPCIDKKPILTETWRRLYHSNDCLILHFGSYRDFSAGCGCGNAPWSPKLHPPG